jgi:hypothetical protein
MGRVVMDSVEIVIVGSSVRVGGGFAGTTVRLGRTDGLEATWRVVERVGTCRRHGARRARRCGDAVRVR